MIEQILTNLIENAWKYTPDQGTIKIIWSQKDLHTVLEVIDNGETIPREHHARIFERFYRIDSHRSRDKGGTGLGLAIVKHIANKHGGSVTITSAPEGGNIFKVTLPAEKLKTELL